MIFVYYDSKTGNVQRFIDKVRKERPEWSYIKIDDSMEIENEGHLVTYTTNFGEVSSVTTEFLKKGNNSSCIKSVSSSGNMNWGTMYAVAADKINDEYGIPVLMKFELSGTSLQVKYFIDYVEEK